MSIQELGGMIIAGLVLVIIGNALIAYNGGEQKVFGTVTETRQIVIKTPRETQAFAPAHERWSYSPRRLGAPYIR